MERKSIPNCRPGHFPSRMPLSRRCGPAADLGPLSHSHDVSVHPIPRRVKGAWWPPRSSKPLSARSTGRGMFDSYPLRHSHPSAISIAIGHRPSAIGHRPLAIGYRLSAIGYRLLAIGYRLLAIGYAVARRGISHSQPPTSNRGSIVTIRPSSVSDLPLNCLGSQKTHFICHSRKGGVSLVT
jgi:hypothetical protein